ncbi:MAG TPA: divalent-cation tolerance protein CutA [Candidatus Manganitrophaceae bacterium]|nr:divalent-cation tolerance protein CutA [Candidatus Manganitrophaceae bacterium]
MNEVVVFVTTSSKEEGEKIGRYLVENRLAACANILPGVTSIFSWEGKICREEESLVVLKTKRELFQRLAEEVRKLHSYSVPEIIAIPLVEGASSYLEWIRKNTL